MKSFIPLLGGITIANAIGATENNGKNQILFNESYDQKSYTGLFSLYDKVIDNIKDIDIKAILQKVKITSLHQLEKCKETLEEYARASINDSNREDRINIRAKMFVRNLELLSYAGEDKDIVLKLQKEYFMGFFDKAANQIGHDQDKAEILEDMYTIVKNNGFKPQEMIDLIDKID